MPLSRPFAPFRSQPAATPAPRKMQIAVESPEDGAVAPSVKARRRGVKIAAAAARPQLRVLRPAGE